MNMDAIKITLKLKINTTEDILSILNKTTFVYTESFNRVCKEGWNMGRINGVELHHKTYFSEREITKLPSQLVISARTKATEALSSARALKKKRKKVSCPVSKKASIRYDNRSSLIRLSDEYATIATIEGRKRINLKVSEYHKKFIHGKVCSSDLCIGKKNRFFLHVVVEIPIEKQVMSGNVIGVDLGVNRPAVTSNADFYGERRWKDIEARRFRLRSSLQAKGTKSAKRHLKKLSGKVNRFRKDCDHVISKRIVTSVQKGTMIVLEDLTDIRSRVKCKKRQRRRIHSWSFNRLQTYLAYKSALNGVFVDYVDPRYTSQKCSRCGYIKRSNRKTQSWFVCGKCGFQHNADLNASKNIRSNYIAWKGISVPSGLLSTSLSSPFPLEASGKL